MGRLLECKDGRVLVVGWSIRAQLATLVLVVCSAIAALLGVVLPHQIQEMGTASMERRAVALAGVLSSAVAPAVDFDDDLSAAATLSHLKDNEEVLFALVWGRGDAPLAAFHDERAPGGLVPESPDEIEVAFTTEHAIVTAPIQTESGGAGVLVVGLSLDGLRADTRAGRTLVLLVVGAVLLLGVGLAWILGALLVQPIQRVVEAARLVADGNLSVEGIGLQPNGQWRDSDNEAVLLTGAVSEMATQMARQLQSLRAAEREARAGSEAKSMFLANMSHELRTPLNAILGYSEILLEELEDEPQHCSDLRRIWTSGSHLLRLINDILDLAKIESGKMDILVEEVQIGALLEEVVASVTPAAVRNGNQILARTEPLATVGHTDETRLRQILVNLASNAVKFTHEGTVMIQASRAGDVLVFEVSDDGIGIPQDKLSKLFRPFVQADASTTKRYGGTGLGLVLVRHMCNLLGGDVTVRSVVGRGSTFTATILDHRRKAALVSEPPSLSPGGCSA